MLHSLSCAVVFQRLLSKMEKIDNFRNINRAQEDAAAAVNRYNYSIPLDTPNWTSSPRNANRK